jgi:hypothetical protein
MACIGMPHIFVGKVKTAKLWHEILGKTAGFTRPTIIKTSAMMPSPYLKKIDTPSQPCHK